MKDQTSDRQTDAESTVALNRRGVLVSAGTVAASALAGCGGSDGNSDDTETGDGGGDDDTTSTDEMGEETTDDGGMEDITEDGGMEETTEDGGMEETTEEMGSSGGLTGSISQNAIDGIEITELNGELTGRALSVNVGFENTGEETIEYDTFGQPYSWTITAYDESDDVLHEDADPGLFWWETASDIIPGETGGVKVKSSFDESSQTARYEISIECSDSKDNVYC